MTNLVSYLKEEWQHYLAGVTTSAVSLSTSMQDRVLNLIFSLAAGVGVWAITSILAKLFKHFNKLS